MSIDHSTHSLFGVSKAAADLLVQEYGRYFGMPTVCFRGGCLTGPQHAGAQLHGFLAYLMQCTVTGDAVHGLRLRRQAGARQHPRRRRGARVRGLPRAPRAPAAVYNLGGGRESNVSMLEAIAAVRARSRAASSTGRSPTRPASATTAGGSQRPRRVQARLPRLGADVRHRGRPARDPRRATSSSGRPPARPDGRVGCAGARPRHRRRRVHRLPPRRRAAGPGRRRRALDHLRRPPRPGSRTRSSRGLDLHVADVRELDLVRTAFAAARPEVVLTSPPRSTSAARSPTRRRTRW